MTFNGLTTDDLTPEEHEPCGDEILTESEMAEAEAEIDRIQEETMTARTVRNYTSDEKLRKARHHLQQAWHALFAARCVSSDDQESFDAICKALKQTDWAQSNTTDALMRETGATQ